MTEALRIFRKDVDYLRIEIAIFVLVCAVFIWMYQWSESLVELAAVWLIARAVHADAIPGDRQFWLTRPYSRGSLIAAKLLFVAVCISLPIALAELTIALKSGFTLSEAIPPLLLSQALLFVFGALPAAALAALTAWMVPFMLAALALALVSIGGAGALAFWFPGYEDSVPGPLEWIRSTLFAIPVAVITIMVLIGQYKSRATHSGRIMAMTALSAAVLLVFIVPASVALKTQSLFSRRPGLSDGITVIRVPSARGFQYSGTRMITALPLALGVDHLPSNTEVRVDDFHLAVFLPDRPLTLMGQPAANRLSQENGRAIFEVSTIVNPAQYWTAYAQPLTIKGTLWLTLFGDDEKSLISLRTPGTIAQDGLHCKAARISEHAWMTPAPPGEQPEWHPADTIVCASLFQWPRKLVYAESGDSESEFGNTRISYAPFPWGLSLNPLQVRWSESLDADKATIVTRRPLAHFRRDFEWTGVQITTPAIRLLLKGPPPPPPPPGRHK